MKERLTQSTSRKILLRVRSQGDRRKVRRAHTGHSPDTGERPESPTPQSGTSFVGLSGNLGRTLQAKDLGALTAWATPRWGARATWELALGSIVALALVAMALLDVTWRVRLRS